MGKYSKIRSELGQQSVGRLIGAFENEVMNKSWCRVCLPILANHREGVAAVDPIGVFPGA